MGGGGGARGGRAKRKKGEGEREEEREVSAHGKSTQSKQTNNENAPLKLLDKGLAVAARNPDLLVQHLQ